MVCDRDEGGDGDGDGDGGDGDDGDGGARVSSTVRLSRSKNQMVPIVHPKRDSCVPDKT